MRSFAEKPKAIQQAGSSGWGAVFCHTSDTAIRCMRLSPGARSKMMWCRGYREIILMILTMCCLTQAHSELVVISINILKSAEGSYICRRNW